MQIIGTQPKNAFKKIDNLIKCLIDVSNNTQNRFSLLYRVNDEKNENKDSLEQIEVIKSSISTPDTNVITQNIIDEICNKINENTTKGKYMKKCLLLKDQTRKNKKNNTENVALIYEYKENFLVLRTTEDSSSGFEKIHEIINNLLCEELLLDLCKFKYKQFGGKEISEIELNKLYNILSELKISLNDCDEDKKTSEFLNHLKIPVLSKKTITEKLLDSLFNSLFDLFSETIENSSEYDSIITSIQFFRDNYIKRMELLLMNC